MIFRKAFERERCVKKFTKPSKTKQYFKDSCDIHKILENFTRTGLLESQARRKPVYADLPDTLDFKSAMDKVLAAEDAFSSVPARVRDSFQNSPLEFIRAFESPDGRAKLERLGVISPSETSEASPNSGDKASESAS